MFPYIPADPQPIIDLLLTVAVPVAVIWGLSLVSILALAIDARRDVKMPPSFEEAAVSVAASPSSRPSRPLPPPTASQTLRPARGAPPA